MRRSSEIRLHLAPNPNRLLRRYDLIEEYGLTSGAAYELLRKYGVKLGRGWYVKRAVAEWVFEGGLRTKGPE